MQKTLAVMAAGIGSRYGGLKQMDPLGPSGEFIIDYSVYDAIRAGFNRVVFIIRRDLEDDFKRTIGARVAKQVTTDYAFQELADLPAGMTPPEGRTKPWGTVQAVLACADLIRGPFAVINADDYYGEDSYAVLSRALDKLPAAESRHCMVGFALNNTLSEHGSVNRGICDATGDRVLKRMVEIDGIEKAGDHAQYTDSDGQVHVLSGRELVSMNMWGFSPAALGQFREQFTQFLRTGIDKPKSELVLPTAIGALVAEGKAVVEVIETSSAWFGITHPEDRAGVQRKIADLVAAGHYPRDLWGDSPPAAVARP